MTGLYTQISVCKLTLNFISFSSVSTTTNSLGYFLKLEHIIFEEPLENIHKPELKVVTFHLSILQIILRVMQVDF